MNNLKYIFISSTFSDFHSERDILNNKILPKLNEKLRPLGYEVCFIDLRWGINDKNDEQTENYLHIINTCINEVRNSKPYFILFLGDNIGTKIEKDLIEKIYKFNEINQENESKSITQIEIDASPIFSDDNSKCLVFKRNLNEVPEHLKIKFLNETNNDYVNKIKNALQNKQNFVEYDGKVLEDGSVSFNEEVITKKIIDFIYDDYLKRENNNKNKSIFEIEKDIFQAKIEQNSSVFAARKTYIENIKKDINSKSVVTISGESGIGKTSLMLELYNEIASKNKTCFLLGNCYGKGDIEEVLNYISFDLTGKKLPSEETDGNSILLCHHNFTKMLFSLNKDEEYYIFVDAFEKIETYGLFERNRIFESYKIPKNVHIVLSGISLENADYEIKSFDPHEITEVLNKRMQHYKKQLPEEFNKEVEKGCEEKYKKLKSPILLSLAADDLIFIKKEDFQKLNSSDYNKSLSDLLLSKIELCESNPIDEFNRKLNLLAITSTSALDCLKILAVNERGCTLKQIESIMTSWNGSFSMFDFELAKSIFFSQISLSKDGIFSIDHDLFRNSVLRLTNNVEAQLISSLSLSYLTEKVESTDFINIFELLVKTEDDILFCKILESIILKNDHKEEITNALHNFLVKNLCNKDGDKNIVRKYLKTLFENNKILFYLVLCTIKNDYELFWLYSLYNETFDEMLEYLDENFPKNSPILISKYAMVLLLNGEPDKGLDILNIIFKKEYDMRIHEGILLHVLKLELMLNTYNVDEIIKVLSNTADFISQDATIESNKRPIFEIADDSFFLANTIAKIPLYLYITISNLNFSNEELDEYLDNFLSLSLNQLYGFCEKDSKNEDAYETYIILQAINLMNLHHKGQLKKDDLFMAAPLIMNESILSLNYYNLIIILDFFTRFVDTLKEKYDTNLLLNYISRISNNLLIIRPYINNLSMLANCLNNIYLTFLNCDRSFYKFYDYLIKFEQTICNFETKSVHHTYSQLIAKRMVLHSAYYLKDNDIIEKYEKDIKNLLVDSGIKIFPELPGILANKLKNSNIKKSISSNQTQYDDCNKKLNEFLDQLVQKFDK